MSDADTWRELERRFRALQPEGKDGLRAEWYDLEKRWSLRDAPNDSVSRRFQSAAKKAAVTLGLLSPEAPDAWLGWLKDQMDLLPHETSAATWDGTGVVAYGRNLDIPRVCEVSADYCERLGDQAGLRDAARRAAAATTNLNDGAEAKTAGEGQSKHDASSTPNLDESDQDVDGDLAGAPSQETHGGRVAPAVHANIFRCLPNGRWEMEYGGQRKTISQHVGFEPIRRLLESPETPISATSLLGRESIVLIDDKGVQVEPPSEGGSIAGARQVNARSEGTPAIDDVARASLKARLDDIGEERVEALKFQDDSRVSELDEEVRKIGAHLRAGTTRSGTPRRLGSDRERDSNSARKNYNTALRAIGRFLPSLHQHLTDSIQPGSKFIYSPSSPVTWDT